MVSSSVLRTWRSFFLSLSVKMTRICLETEDLRFSVFKKDSLYDYYHRRRSFQLFGLSRDFYWCFLCRNIFQVSCLMIPHLQTSSSDRYSLIDELAISDSDIDNDQNRSVPSIMCDHTYVVSCVIKRILELYFSRTAFLWIGSNALCKDV